MLGIRCAFANLAIRGTDAMPELRDLDCGPFELWKGADNAGHRRGLADVPRVSADDNDQLFSLSRLSISSSRRRKAFTSANRSGSFPRRASCRRYSFNGRAGVPQNGVLPRRTFEVSTPAP